MPPLLLSFFPLDSHVSLPTFHQISLSLLGNIYSSLHCQEPLQKTHSLSNRRNCCDLLLTKTIVIKSQVKRRWCKVALLKITL